MGSKLYIYHEILNPRITPLSGLPLVYKYIEDIDIKNKNKKNKEKRKWGQLSC